jgi:hypothetical protein
MSNYIRKLTKRQVVVFNSNYELEPQAAIISVVWMKSGKDGSGTGYEVSLDKEMQVLLEKSFTESDPVQKELAALKKENAELRNTNLSLQRSLDAYTEKDYQGHGYRK